MGTIAMPSRWEEIRISFRSFPPKAKLFELHNSLSLVGLPEKDVIVGREGHRSML
jgi:hypothetical protein